MDGMVYINLETGEIKDTIEGYIHCDREISKAIYNLNKKGYLTKASCAGHTRFAIYEENNCDIDFLEEVKNNPLCEIIEVREKDFDYYWKAQITSIYVMFKENYQFSTLPEGFELESDGIIEHIVYFYHDGKLRRRKDIQRELDKYQNILTEWTENL